MLLTRCAALSLALALPLVACSKKPAAPTCATCVIADQHGFTPSSITVPKGTPGSRVTLTFTRTSDDTCARDVVFPDLDIKKPLPLDVPVTVDVPSDVEKTLTFQCGMKMYKSSLIVK